MKKYIQFLTMVAFSCANTGHAAGGENQEEALKKGVRLLAGRGPTVPEDEKINLKDCPEDFQKQVQKLANTFGPAISGPSFATLFRTTVIMKSDSTGQLYNVSFEGNKVTSITLAK